MNLYWLCAAVGALLILLLVGLALQHVFFVARREVRRRHYADRFDVKELTRRLGLSLQELQAIQPAYDERFIPKRRPGKSRRLLVPRPELKRVQRLIHRRLLARLHSHPTATGFQPRTSIMHNAAVHVGQAVVIRMDIVDFFATTSVDRVKRYFRRIGWTEDAAALLTRLTTHDGGLPQGAPTSPRLSNLVNFVFDAQLERSVAKRKGVYTRYADDITISFPKDYPRRVRGVVQYARRLAKAHGYRIHTRGKLRILRRHQQQRVCGLVVNEKAQLPREKRRWLRAVEHRLRTRGECSLSPNQLAGWRAFQAMIEKQRNGVSP